MASYAGSRLRGLEAGLVHLMAPRLTSLREHACVADFGEFPEESVASARKLRNQTPVTVIAAPEIPPPSSRELHELSLAAWVG
eukprot:scaffold58292_cov31-Tisochrysis_lutea.AAC.3